MVYIMTIRFPHDTVSLHHTPVNDYFETTDHNIPDTLPPWQSLPGIVFTCFCVSLCARMRAHAYVSIRLIPDVFIAIVQRERERTTTVLVIHGTRCVYASRPTYVSDNKSHLLILLLISVL